MVNVYVIPEVMLQDYTVKQKKNEDFYLELKPIEYEIWLKVFDTCFSVISFNVKNS